MGKIQDYFKIKERKTSVKQEALGGLVTFLSMAYIIFVNPNILSMTGMPKEALISVTCIAAIFGTLLVGIWAKVPFAMAPGMGLNAMFAFTLVLGQGVSWQDALGVVFLSGVFFTIISFFGVRHKIVEAIPPSLQVAMGCGVGFFIAFIGFKQLGLIVAHPDTLVTLGKFTPAVIIGLITLFVTVILEIYKVKGAILIGIVGGTCLGIAFDPNVHLPTHLFSLPPSIAPIFVQLNILGVLKLSFASAIFSFLFVSLFDSIGTAIACSYEANLVGKNGKMPHLKKVLEADGIATMFSGILGTSNTVVFIESATGIANGAKTGLSSVFVALFFFLALFFSPIITIVPAYATAPALVLVGSYMSKHLSRINFTDLHIGVPAFLTMIMMPLTYSISNGIAYGFSSFIILALFTKNTKEVTPMMWGVGVFSILSIVIAQMK
jgi:AGZA family xanthine/uracil permease-like MFS transporter